MERKYIDMLKGLYKVASPSNGEVMMNKHISSLLENIEGVSFASDRVGNIFAIKGESDTYPCVVAHMDEVHQRSKQGFTVIEHEDVIVGYNVDRRSFEGIGADDKNGVLIALMALTEYPIMKAAFFVGEEVGCVGSSAANIGFFNDCRWVVQCDRKGNSDFITNAGCVELCSDEFVNAIEIDKFGYHTENGLMTDVMELKEKGVSVSCCNISCGYYNPHTSNELTSISDLDKCWNLVSHIIETLTDVYPHQYTRISYRSNYGYGGGKYGYLYDDYYYEHSHTDYQKKTKEVVFDSFDDEEPSYQAEYDEMIEMMTDEISMDAFGFNLDVFFLAYSEDYPNSALVWDDFCLAYEEVTGDSFYLDRLNELSSEEEIEEEPKTKEI